jgi:hypothetical protein
LEYWRIGALECWSTGVLECWSVGVLEDWRIGVSGGELVGKFVSGSQPETKMEVTKKEVRAEKQRGKAAGNRSGDHPGIAEGL